MSKKSFVEIFSAIPDPRIERKKLHQLVDMFVAALCSVLSGAETWTEVEEFSKMQIDWLRKFVPLENGVPSHDTFSRVFSLIDPEEFGNCFLEWMQEVCKTSEQKLIAIDGKTLRRSHDKTGGKAAIHMVSAWAVENKLCLGQLKTEEKSNEITAIPELLKMLDIKGCIVTIDAMGCQKKIAKAITKKGGDYVLGLKGNQTKLRQEVEDFFFCAERDKFSDMNFSHHKTVEKNHGRIESREYFIVEEKSFETKNQWGGLNAVGMVKSERRIGKGIECDTRFYICSCMMSAEEFAGAVRGHWGIENSLHWVLDVVFREDECRVRKGYGAENMSSLRRLALNLLREEKKICKLGVKGKRFRCAIDREYLQHVLGF